MAETNESPKGPPALPSTLKALVEALVFAAQEPLTVQQIKAIYQGENRNDESRQLDAETIRQAVTDLNKEYAKADRPYRIVQIAGGFQFSTITEYADWLGLLYKEQGRRKLSQSGVETLAIIAYKQPITKSEVESIRGVNCDYVLKTLLEKELVTVTGRAETVGRPLLYGTTREFLKYFGLNEITDLPRPREIEEILGESQFETERRMLEAQQGAEQMKKEQEDFKSRLPHIPKRKPDLETKGVEIFARKKTREIRVITDEERTAREPAGQESISFDAPASGPPPLQQGPGIPVPPDTLIPADAGGTSDVGSAAAGGDVQPVPGPAETLSAEGSTAGPVEEHASQHPAVELPGVPEESVRTPETTAGVSESAESVAAADEGSYAGATEHEEEFPAPTAEGMTEGKPKTRWQSWKEKVTGFIRKIFG